MRAATTSPCTVVETHISRLFFTPDRVYKLLKPVRTSYLDFSSPDRRVAAARLELQLNRRIAPDVYLGEADVHEGDELVDRMIVMRRLPDDRRLSALAAGPTFIGDLDAVARAVAAFHARRPPIYEPVPLASAEGLARFWKSSFADMRPFVGPVLDADEFDEVEQLAIDYLRHHGGLLEDRRRAGLVRDGHGDLIADDIFVLDDGPRILDCLAFDPAYRISDVLADIAFLVMDVELLAGREPARHLLKSYCSFSNEHHPASLAHHYVAYRAHVRAKVATARWSQGDSTARDSARMHHAQAVDHLRRARTTVMLLGGGPGTGKTTLANELGERLGWVAIDSDTLRKELRGIDHHDHRVSLHPDLYSSEVTEAMYRQLVARGAAMLDAGESVILDATWARGSHRDLATRMARSKGARLVEIECRLDPDLARRRIANRMGCSDYVSDATPDLVGTARDAWPSALPVDTADHVDSICDEVVSLVGAIGTFGPRRSVLGSPPSSA